MTERASPLMAAHCVSLDCTFDGAIITPTFRKAPLNREHSFLSASSPSQALRASSPKGRAFSRRQTFRYIQNLSLWERWHRVSDDGEGKPAPGGAPRPFRLRLRWGNHHANLPKGTAKPRAQLLASVLALSGASRQLSQRESFFEKANFPVHPKPLTLGEVASRSDDGEGKPASGGAPRPFSLRLRWSSLHLR